jgi:hypothetical protein
MPNKPLQPTAYSVRCAPASGRGSPAALDLSTPYGHAITNMLSLPHGMAY